MYLFKQKTCITDLIFAQRFGIGYSKKNAQNSVYSIDKVTAEIEAGTDELTDWMHTKAQNLFHKTDVAVFPYISTVSNSVIGKGYEQSAINIFTNS